MVGLRTRITTVHNWLDRQKSSVIRFNRPHILFLYCVAYYYLAAHLFSTDHYRSILLFSTATALITNTAARARVTGALFSASCSCSIRSSSWMEAWCTVVRFLLVRRVNNLRVLLFLFSFFSNSIYDSTRVQLPVPVGHYLVVPKKTTIRTLSVSGFEN